MGLNATGREHNVRKLRGDRGCRPLGTEESDITCAAIHRAVGRHHRSAWVLIRTGVDADRAAGVLIAALVGIGPRACQIVLVQALQVRSFLVICAKSDIDHSELAAVRQRRLQ